MPRECGNSNNNSNSSFRSSSNNNNSLDTNNKLCQWTLTSSSVVHLTLTPTYPQSRATYSHIFSGNRSVASYDY